MKLADADERKLRIATLKQTCRDAVVARRLHENSAQLEALDSVGLAPQEMTFGVLLRPSEYCFRLAQVVSVGGDSGGACREAHAHADSF